MINKIKLLLLSLMIISISAQEFDESFLNSLPDDVRKELEEQNTAQKQNSEETYRPYLYSSKLRQYEELQSLKERLEIDLLELEERLNSGDELNVEKELKLFGEDFFNTFQTSFMPINEPNPDSGYVLDVGDILKIQLVGQYEYIEDFLINRNGSINLKDIGEIVVAGLSISDASQLIKSKVNSAMIGTEAFINLAEIRDINVLVSGNAKNSGIYTLTGNSNILHAISAAGGVSKFGSLREINLIRDNTIIESLDLYDILITGQYNIKKRLRSGDIVFVEAKKNIVTIDGAVHRPAKYEVLDEQNLFSIIEYANGIKRTADRENISLERILDGSLKTIPVRNDIQFKTIEAQDGDFIYVREFPYRMATISGSVFKPGTYTMSAGETLNDLVQKAGGYTDNSYQFGAIYTNEDAKLIDQKSKEILYQSFLSNVIDIYEQSGEGFGLTSIIELVRELNNTKSYGRVVVDLLSESSIDLYKVKEGDSLFIPEKNNVVYVYGEISTEGAVMYSEGESVEYFINKSGGFSKFSDNDSIYILHPNGETQLYKSRRNIFENSPKSEIKIYPGSIIFVPRAISEAAPRRLAAQAYVSILGNLGIALASLSAINNN
ncbi:SLBB domain-containing protein [Gammaproteobacteria bacterium]|nr:SLBB domain-containing protein [Gammaproteobacteria bacterium]